MAGKKKLFHFFTLFVLLATLLNAEASHKNRSKKKVHLTTPKKTSNDFLFVDDEQQMLRDEGYESSGDSFDVNPEINGEETGDVETKPEITVDEVPETPVDETETLENLGENSASQNENDIFIEENINNNLSIDDLLKEEVDLDWVPPSRPNVRPVKPPTRPVNPPVQQPVKRPARPNHRPTRPVPPVEPVYPPTFPEEPPVWPEEPIPIQPTRPCQAAKRRCRPGSRRNVHCQTAKRRCQLSSRLPPLPNYRPLPATFSPAKLCGKTYYCRKGYRGPCNRNEIFTSTSSVGSLSRPVTSFRPPTCSLSSPPTGCISSQSDSFALASYRPKSPGYCTIRYAHKPCFGYPTNYRYSKRTKQCFPTKTSLYFPRTRRTAPRCSRPNYVRCPKTQRCFPAYTKGSCSRGQWLVPFGNQGLSTCRKCPCPSLADGQHIYWSGKNQRHGRPGCYKSYTRGPCRSGMRFVINDILTGSTSCMPINQRPAKKYDTKHQSTYNYLMNDWNLFYGNAPTNDQSKPKFEI